MKTNCEYVIVLRTCHAAYSQEKYILWNLAHISIAFMFSFCTISQKESTILISVSNFTATISTCIVFSLEMLVFHCRDRNSIMAFTCPYLMSHDLPSFNQYWQFSFFPFLLRCLLHILDKMLVLIHNVVQNTHLSTCLCMMTKEQANLCFIVSTNV